MSGPEGALRRLAFASAGAFAVLAPWTVAGLQIAAGAALAAVAGLALLRRAPANALHGPVLAFAAASAVALAMNPGAAGAAPLMAKFAFAAVAATAASAGGSAESAPRRLWTVALLFAGSTAAVSVLALVQVRTGFDPIHALGLRTEPVVFDAPDAPGRYVAIGAYAGRHRLGHVCALFAAFAAGALIEGGALRETTSLGLRGGVGRLRGAALGAAAALATAGAAAAYARAALGALAAAVVLAAVRRFGAGRRRALAALAGLAAAVAAALALAPGNAARIAGTLSLEANRDRQFIWERAAEVLADVPTFGVGPGAYPAAAAPYYDFADPRFPMRTWAHDAFVTVWLELGVAGLVAFAALFVALFAAVRPRGDALDPLRFGASTAAVAYLLLCLVHDPPHNLEVSAVAFFLFGLGAVEPPAAIAAAPDRRAPH